MTDKLKELATAAARGKWTQPWSEIISNDHAAYIAAASPDAILALLKRAEDAEAEVEQLRVQLAGCGVAAMQNTESSKFERAKRGDYGYSESYAAVCQAVDREIALRTKLAAMESLLGAALGALRYHTEQTRPIHRTYETITMIEASVASLASGAAQKETDRA